MGDASLDPGDAPVTAVTPTPAKTERAKPATLLRNSTYGVFARGLGLFGAAIAAVITIRSLDVNAYGQLAAALALVSIIASLSQAGIVSLATREIATQPRLAERQLNVALAAGISLSALGAALLVPLGLALDYPSRTLGVLGVGAAIVMAQGVLAAFEAMFQAHRVFIYIAAYSLLQYVALVAGTIIAAVVGAGPVGFAIAIAVSYAAATLTALVALRRGLDVRPQLSGAWRSVPAFVRAAGPIALIGSAAVIYGRIDVLMLSKIGGSREVAVYNVPLILVETVQVLPAVASTAFFPLLTAQLRDSPQDARTSFDLMARLYLLVSVPIAFVLGVGGRAIIEFAFGNSYRDSGPVVAILAVTIVLAFFNYLLWYGMLATYKERGRTPAMLVGLLLNIVLNASLIPSLGPRGAATSLAISDTFMVCWLLLMVSRSTFPFRWGALLGRPLTGAAAAGIVLALPLPLPELAIGVLMALLYVLIVLGTGYISRAEWTPLTAPARYLLGRVVRGDA